LVVIVGPVAQGRQLVFRPLRLGAGGGLPLVVPGPLAGLGEPGLGGPGTGPPGPAAVLISQPGARLLQEGREGLAGPLQPLAVGRVGPDRPAGRAVGLREV
jgi:hypothetical protein